MVVRDVERRRRGPITRWNYVWALLRVLPKYTPPRLKVMIPGEDPVTAGFVLISNCSRYAGLFRLTSRRQPDEATFDVYFFRNASRRALAAAAILGVAGQIAGAGGCERRHLQTHDSLCLRVKRDNDLAVRAALHVRFRFGGFVVFGFR